MVENLLFYFNYKLLLDKLKIHYFAQYLHDTNPKGN